MGIQYIKTMDQLGVATQPITKNKVKIKHREQENKSHSYRVE